MTLTQTTSNALHDIVVGLIYIAFTLAMVLGLGGVIALVLAGLNTGNWLYYPAAFGSFALALAMRRASDWIDATFDDRS